MAETKTVLDALKADEARANYVAKLPAVTPTAANASFTEQAYDPNILAPEQTKAPVTTKTITPTKPVTPVPAGSSPSFSEPVYDPNILAPEQIVLKDDAKDKESKARDISVGAGAAITPTVPGQQSGAQTGTDAQTGTQAGTTQQGNPYLEALTQMKFEYSPAADPDYLQSAANLENTVTQMMQGRGGVYSSVAQSALQSRLIYLQNDMRKAKYAEFLEERNFNMSMAKYMSDLQAQEWQQNMQEKQFALNVQKEAFDQQMAIANYNLARSAQAFSQKMRQAELSAQIAAQDTANKLALAKQETKQKELLVQTNALYSQSNRETFTTMLEKWWTAGFASSDVAAYFGVGVNDRIANVLSQKNISLRLADINATDQQILSEANQLGMDKAFLETVERLLAPTADMPIADLNTAARLGQTKPYTPPNLSTIEMK